MYVGGCGRGGKYIIWAGGRSARKSRGSERQVLKRAVYGVVTVGLMVHEWD